ncbi:MAG TPA: hypothetical protein VM433_06665 [Mycobacteriales bacterium]|nr:hypothetical protein [Mycobacteriales bacterium]
MLQMPRGVRTRVSRRIDADPSSTALLLAGPPAVDLWPGARRVGEADGGVLVEARPPAEPQLVDAEPARVSVRALPPRRTPTSYVTRFEWSGDDLPPVSGRLTLAYAPTGDGASVTHAVLELEPVTGDAPYSRRALTTMGEGFLGNLARAAENRNRAA